MASVGTFAAIRILFAVAGLGVLGPVAGASPFDICKGALAEESCLSIANPSPCMAVSYVRSLHSLRRAFATLQSMGMTGQLVPVAARITAAAAAAAGGLAWAFGGTGQGEERPHQE